MTRSLLLLLALLLVGCSPHHYEVQKQSDGTTIIVPRYFDGYQVVPKQTTEIPCTPTKNADSTGNHLRIPANQSGVLVTASGSRCFTSTFTVQPLYR